MAIGVFLIVAIGGYALYVHQKRAAEHPYEPPPKLAAADRAPLDRVVVDDRGWLVHRSLGFRVADPGRSFQPSAAIDAGGPSTEERRMTWVYEEHATGRRFVVTLSISASITPPTFSFIVSNARADLQHAGATVDAVRSDYHAGHSRCELDATFHGRTALMRLDTFVPAAHPTHEYLVTVTGPTELRHTVASFVPP